MQKLNLSAIFNKIIQRQNLTTDEMTHLMQMIIDGQLTDIQLSGLLIGMRCKGETVTELVAACKVLRELVTPVDIDVPHLIDIVGTGGDQANTFNISTASSFVAAAAGAHVAKHGNRSVSSSCGSADALEAAGVNLNLNPEQIANCIKKMGLGFMFAPQHHKAMQHVKTVRKELGVRTFFNLLGPLTNPANVKRQILGVFANEWVIPLAHVLQQLGSTHVLVVHSEDGLDEISIGAETNIAELKDEQITNYKISPEQFGLTRSSIKSLKVKNPQDSLLLIKEVLEDKPGPARDIVLLNAGAAIYVSGLTNTLTNGVAKAKEVLVTGKALTKFQTYLQFTKKLCKTS